MEWYETEEQQIEAIRAWFKKRSKLLISIALLIAVLVGGGQYILHHQNLAKEQASGVYQAMISAIDKQDNKTAKSKAQYLSREYESSVYGTLAKLYLAKVAIQEKQLEQAKPYLEAVMQKSKVPEFKTLARLKLAKVLFTEKKIEAALALLDQSPEGNPYTPLLKELKADILRSQNKPQEAYALYKQAQEAILKKELHNPLLKMKLEELGES